MTSCLLAVIYVILAQMPLATTKARHIMHIADQRSSIEKES